MRATHAWGQRRRHVVRQIEVLEREVDKVLDLLREVALDRETLQVNQEHWRQSSE